MFDQANYFRSVHDVADLPPDAGVEIAFAGRSNAGKSSAINALIRRKGMAFVSKTPGRTQTINFFSVAPNRYIVDLPGYGYAAVSIKERRQWGKLISTYIEARSALRGIVLIMDARHPFTELDERLLNWISPLHKPTHILLTKADKLTAQERSATLHAAEIAANSYPLCSVQLFSATTKVGVSTARKTIAHWFGTHP